MTRPEKAPPKPRAIRLRRQALGLTLADFAARMGRSTTTVHLWETGARTPGKAIWGRIATALGCSKADLAR